MGCTTSNAEQNNLQMELDSLKLLLNEKELKFHEQQNLLRFKVEVLVNMLSVEEERNISTTKRLEILKYLIYSQGITETKLNQLLTDKLDEDSKIELQERLSQSLVKTSEDAKSFINTKNEVNQSKKSNSFIEIIDLSNSINSMKEEFSKYSNDILHCFADKEGKILPTISMNLFIKQLFLTTKNISKKELNVLALRFQDGYGEVNIIEFLDFFTTPEYVRKAKNASNAVRMSLNLLTIDMNDNESSQIQKDLEDPDFEFIRTHMTDKLDQGARRVLLMWKFIRSTIISTLKINEDTESSRHIIDTKWFMDALFNICTVSSIPLQAAVDKGLCKIKVDSMKNLLNNMDSTLDVDKLKNNLSSPKNEKDIIEIEYLEEEDLIALTERFEIGNHIDSYYFIKYFDELYEKLKNNPKYLLLHKDSIGVSPFITSSEWLPLKESSAILKSLKEKKNNSPIVTLPPSPVPTPIPSPIPTPSPEVSSNPPIKPMKKAPLKISTPLSDEEDSLPKIKQDHSFISPEKIKQKQQINFLDDEEEVDMSKTKKKRSGRLIKRVEKGIDKEIIDDDDEDEYDVMK